MIKQCSAAALFIALLGTNAGADEIILNGKPCNSLCQSWMGVGQRKTEAAKAPVQTFRATAAEPPRELQSAPPAVTPPAAAPVVVSRSPAPPTPSVAPHDYADVAPMYLAPDILDERVEAPDPARIAAVRGVVMVESPEDREANRKEKAALQAMTTKRDNSVGDVNDR